MEIDYTSLLLFLLPRHNDLHHPFITYALYYVIMLRTESYAPDLITTLTFPVNSAQHQLSKLTIATHLLLTVSILPNPSDHGPPFDTTTHTIKFCSWYWRPLSSTATTISGLLYPTHDNNLISVPPPPPTTTTTTTVPNPLRNDAYDELNPCWLTSIIGPLSTGEVRSFIPRSKWWYLSPHGQWF